MKKIVIIGAKGMLGQSLMKVFSGDGKYQVIGWDFADIDIADEKRVFEKIQKEKPDIVINCAAHNAVDKIEESEEEFEKAKKVNGDGPKFLAKACKETDAIFVHYVSDYVFDGEKGIYVETDQANPISKYGISKEMGEKNVKEIGGKYYLIRTSKLFGKPAQSEGAKKSFFAVMLDLAKSQKELRVIDGERSCFTYVEDLAKATKKLIEENFDYGVYHLVNEGAVTWYEGVTELFEIAGIKDVKIIPASVSDFPRPAKRPASSVLKNTKFPKLRSYKEAIAEWLGK